MKTVVLGSGDWGLAFSSVLRGSDELVVWCRDERELAKAENNILEIGLSNVKAELKYSSPLSSKDVLVVAVPSSVMRLVAQELSVFLGGEKPIILSLSKGLDQPGFKTMSQVLLEELPHCSIGIISGPTIAKEILAGKEAKAILAAYDIDTLMNLQCLFNNSPLKLELSLKVVEIEFCAALKGVIAIGTGIATGLELGENFMGLLLTYGLHEFMEIGKFLGISTQQILGIGGLGDLITTSWSSNSRNHRFGCLLAQQISKEMALKEVGMVVEGVQIAKDIAKLASLNVSVGIFRAIANIIDSPTEENLNGFVNTILEHKGII